MQDDKNENVSDILRTAQVIVLALVAGVSIFGVIVLYQAGGDGPQGDGPAVVSLVIAGFSLLCLLTRFVIPSLVVSAACRQIARGTWQPTRRPNEPPPATDEGKLAQVFLTKTIVGSAILEGAAFANLVAYLVEGELYSIILAAVFAAGILAGFPTRSGFDAWHERHVRLVNEFRIMPGDREP